MFRVEHLDHKFKKPVLQDVSFDITSEHDMRERADAVTLQAGQETP